MALFGTGAAAAALAGAAGLGAVGLAGLGIAALGGSRRRGGSGRGGFGRGGRGGRGGFGRGGRGGGRGRFRGRGRRSVTEEKDMKTNEKKKSAPEKKTVTTKLDRMKTEEEKILSAIREADEDLCGFRLVCELSGAPMEELTPDEREILRFVQEGDPAVAPGQGVLPSDPTLQEYQSAARLGATGYDCASIFQTCQLSAVDLLASFRALI